MPIERLPEEVINRISAGEVVQSPTSALKELLENALDAGASKLSIQYRHNGMQLLRVTDNGEGIAYEDLPRVAERFSTSKLRRVEDLSTLRTFGFRGEALASLSYVAHLKIITRNAFHHTNHTPHFASEMTYSCEYHEGKMLTCEPTPHVFPTSLQENGKNTGTVLIIENLFYNYTVRREALLRSSEEVSRMLELVQRYALNNPGIGFRLGSVDKPNQLDIFIPLHLSTSRKVVQHVYGKTLATHILEIEQESETDPSGATKEGEKKLCPERKITEENAFRFRALCSGPFYTPCRSLFIFFVNGRLVLSSSLRRMCEQAYLRALPRKNHVFVFLSLHLDPASLDVNVHPSKQKVVFLFEEKVMERVYDALVETLLECVKRGRPHPPQDMLDKGTSGGEKKKASLYRDAGFGNGGQTISLPALPGHGAERWFSKKTPLTHPPLAPQKRDRSLAQRGDLEKYLLLPLSSVDQGGSTMNSVPREDGGATFGLASQTKENEAVKNSSEASHVDESAPPDSTLCPPSTRTDSESEEEEPSCLSQTLHSHPLSGTPWTSSSDPGHTPSGEASTTPLESSGEVSYQLSTQAPGEHRMRPQLCVPKARSMQSSSLLTSVREVLERFEKEKSELLSHILHEGTFLGSVCPEFLETFKTRHDTPHGRESTNDPFCCVFHEIFSAVDASFYMFIQRETSLYLVDLGALSESLVYQNIFRYWMRWSALRIQPPISIPVLLSKAGKKKVFTEPADGSDPGETAQVCALLGQHTKMLKIYFSLHISENGEELHALPLLLGVESYRPAIERLPTFFHELSKGLKIEHEVVCLRHVATSLAHLYRLCPSTIWKASLPPLGEEKIRNANTRLDSPNVKPHGPRCPHSLDEFRTLTNRFLHHSFFPLLRRVIYLPPTCLLTSRSPGIPERNKEGEVLFWSPQRVVHCLATTESLYKIFERC